MSDRTTEFLKELTELTNKYRIEIAGCGCCGSPWLDDSATGKAIAFDLIYKKEKMAYELLRTND